MHLQVPSGLSYSATRPDLNYSVRPRTVLTPISDVDSDQISDREEEEEEEDHHMRFITRPSSYGSNQSRASPRQLPTTSTLSSMALDSHSQSHTPQSHTHTQSQHHQNNTSHSSSHAHRRRHKSDREDAAYEPEDEQDDYDDDDQYSVASSQSIHSMLSNALETTSRAIRSTLTSATTRTPYKSLRSRTHALRRKTAEGYYEKIILPVTEPESPFVTGHPSPTRPSRSSSSSVSSYKPKGKVPVVTDASVSSGGGGGRSATKRR